MSEPLIPHSISVVLPAYNEEAGIERAVRAVLDYMPTDFADWECVVVDDGSRDKTPAILARLAATDPRLRVVTHETNQGYGKALANGFAAATKELVFFTDGDAQFDIRELGTSVRMHRERGVDALFGFRVYRYDSVLRCMLSWAYNRLVRVLFLVRVRDVDCSWKLFTREVRDALQLESRDFFIDTEIVARTRKAGFKILEVGVRHYPRLHGHTSVRASDIPRTLATVFRMWFRIHFGRRKMTTATAAAPATERG